MLPAGRLHRIGHDSLLVQRQRHQSQTQVPRQRLHPRIGYLLHQHDIPRFGDRRQSHRHGVLATAGHGQSLRAPLEPHLAQPAGSRLSVPAEARVGTVVDQVQRRRLAHHRRHRLPQLGQQRQREQRVGAQVDGALAVVLRRGTGTAADEGAPTHLAAHQAPALGLPVAAGHRG